MLDQTLLQVSLSGFFHKDGFPNLIRFQFGFELFMGVDGPSCGFAILVQETRAEGLGAI